MTLERGDRFAINPAVRSRRLDDDLILLDLRGGEYFSLNPSGASVWQALERGLDLGAIDTEVSASWPVGSEERWRMVTGIVAQLLDRRLVERLGP